MWRFFTSLGAQKDGAVAGGVEMSYSQIVAAVPISATVEATPNDIVIAGSFVADGTSAYLIEFFTPNIQAGAGAGDEIYLNLWEGATNLGRLAIVRTDPNSGLITQRPVHVAYRVIPTAGIHTYKISGWKAGANGSVSAGAGGAGAFLPAFVRIIKVNSASASFGPATYGTTLPANPSDGQEAILVDSVTNPSYQWRFRYNAGSASAYKWEFVGGPPLLSAESGTHNTSSTSYVDLTNGPTVTLPRAGEYDAHWEAALYTDVAGNVNEGHTVALVLNGAALMPLLIYPHAVGKQDSGSRELRFVATVANHVLKLQYKTPLANLSYYSNRVLRVTPVRVA